MYLLFECGLCGNLYQVQEEKFSNSLQKVVCPSCQNFHYFGATQESKEVQSPTIEKIVSQNAAASDPKIEPISKEIFWKCGVCETHFYFNLNAVTSQGIKVTCTTCFSFFILQKVGTMMDLDHMVMHEVSPDQLIPSRNPPSPDLEIPPLIEEGEVSGQFNLNDLREKMEKADQKPVMAPPPPIHISASRPVSKLPPMAKTNPEIIMPPPPAPKVKPVITKPPVVTKTEKPLPKTRMVPTATDMMLANSFMAFQTKKHEFKINKENELTFVKFNEIDPKVKKGIFEKHMIKISIWVSGGSILFLAIVFSYNWYEKKHRKPEPAPPAVQTNPNKPQYGFPEMGE